LFPLCFELIGRFGDVPEVAGKRYQERRYPAYIAERFMSLFLPKRNIKVLHVPMIQFF
jgi:hypothetical protein